MPTLSPSTEAMQALIVFEILEQMQNGSTEIDACTKHGISTQKFRRLRDREAEGTIALQQIIADSAKARLSMIVLAQQTALIGVIADLSSPFLKPLERLSILRTLETMGDKLSVEARIGDGISEGNADVLSGPNLKPGKNRLSVSVQVSVSEPDIVDLPLSSMTDAQTQLPLLELPFQSSAFEKDSQAGYPPEHQIENE